VQQLGQAVRRLPALPRAVLAPVAIGVLLAAARPFPTHGPQLAKTLTPLAGVVGAWRCAGVFPRSGRTIASTISFTPDLQGSWVVLRQDDRPPNRYHALGLWGFDAARHDFVMLLADDFGGHREFRAPGWRHDSLTWTLTQASDDTLPRQQFTYGRAATAEGAGGATMFVTYAVAPRGRSWITVDSLTCTRG
jgi:hypothetical protein